MTLSDGPKIRQWFFLYSRLFVLHKDKYRGNQPRERFQDSSDNVHGVTIWDSRPNVLATTPVTGSGSQGFTFAPITPLILTANTTYMIGSTTSTDGVAIDFPTINSAINYIAETEVPMPNPDDTTPAFPYPGFENTYSANFQFGGLPDSGGFPFQEIVPVAGQPGYYTITNNSNRPYIIGFTRSKTHGRKPRTSRRPPRRIGPQPRDLRQPAVCRPSFIRRTTSVRLCQLYRPRAKPVPSFSSARRQPARRGRPRRLQTAGLIR